MEKLIKEKRTERIEFVITPSEKQMLWAIVISEAQTASEPISIASVLRKLIRDAHKSQQEQASND